MNLSGAAKNESHINVTVFKSKMYHFKQPLIQILNECYQISSFDNSESYYAFRPIQVGRRLVARLCGFLTLIITIPLFFIPSYMILKRVFSFEEDSGAVALIALLITALAFLIGIANYIFVVRLLSPKRKVFLSLNEKAPPIFTLEPKSGEFLFNSTYVLKNNSGEALAYYRKKYFESFFRTKWRCYLTDNSPLFYALEDSLTKALMRRFLGLARFIPKHFDLRGDSNSGESFGYFNRKFSIKDKYELKLDQSNDYSTYIVAMGLLLDTGESR